MKKLALLLTLCSLCVGLPLSHSLAMSNSELLEHEEEIIAKFMEEEKFSRVEDLLTDDMKLEFSSNEFKNFKEQLEKNFGEPLVKRLFLLEREEARDLLRYDMTFSKVDQAQLSFMFNTEGKKPLLDDFALLLPPKPMPEPPVASQKKYKTTRGGIQVEVKEEEPMVESASLAETVEAEPVAEKVEVVQPAAEEKTKEEAVETAPMVEQKAEVAAPAVVEEKAEAKEEAQKVTPVVEEKTEAVAQPIVEDKVEETTSVVEAKVEAEKVNTPVEKASPDTAEVKAEAEKAPAVNSKKNEIMAIKPAAEIAADQAQPKVEEAVQLQTEAIAEVDTRAQIEDIYAATGGRVQAKDLEGTLPAKVKSEPVAEKTVEAAEAPVEVTQKAEAVETPSKIEEKAESSETPAKVEQKVELLETSVAEEKAEPVAASAKEVAKTESVETPAKAEGASETLVAPIEEEKTMEPTEAADEVVKAAESTEASAKVEEKTEAKTPVEAEQKEASVEAPVAQKEEPVEKVVASPSKPIAKVEEKDDIPQDVKVVVGNRPVPNKARVAQRKREAAAREVQEGVVKHIPEEVLEVGRTSKEKAERASITGSAEERAMDAKYQRKQNRMRRIF